MEVELRARFRFLEKVIGELFLRRQTLYPTEVRDHVPKNLDISKLFGSLLIMIS